MARTSYKSFRRENRDKTLHQIVAEMILDLDHLPEGGKLTLDNLSTPDIMIQRYLAGLTAERRLHGAGMVKLLAENLWENFDNSCFRTEQIPFKSEYELAEYMVMEIGKQGKSFKTGRDLMIDGEENLGRLIKDVAFVMQGKPQKYNYYEVGLLEWGLSELKEKKIFSAGYFHPDESILESKLLGILFGQKTSSSANTKQALGWDKDWRLLRALASPYAPKIDEDDLERIHEKGFYLVEDVFRMKMIFGGPTYDESRKSLVSYIDSVCDYLNNHSVFEIVPGSSEDYLSGYSKKGRRRPKEYHIKVRMRPELANHNSTKKMYMPDTIEIQFVTMDEWLRSEFSPDYGRMFYVPRKNRHDGKGPEKNRVFKHLKTILDHTSPTKSNPLLDGKFWRFFGGSYEAYSDGIMEILNAKNAPDDFYSLSSNAENIQMRKEKSH
ncbi:hypothetical protein JXC34_05155 [Candidatus Woesearchaeota archaeon]|nr:hypothetical protein [Candidatus Woesearchaeota archaeon]